MCGGQQRHPLPIISNLSLHSSYCWSWRRMETNQWAMFMCLISLCPHLLLSLPFFHQLSHPDSSALSSILVSSKFFCSFQRLSSDVVVEGRPRAIFLCLIAPLPSTVSCWFVLAFFCVWVGVGVVVSFPLFSSAFSRAMYRIHVVLCEFHDFFLWHMYCHLFS